MSRGKVGFEGQRAVELRQCLRRIVLIFGRPQLEVTDGIVGMARHKPAEFRHALLEPTHLKKREAALAPGNIVTRLQLQITVPSRGRIFQRVQIAGRQGEHLLDVAPLRRQACRLRQ